MCNYDFYGVGLILLFLFAIVSSQELISLLLGKVVGQDCFLFASFGFRQTKAEMLYGDKQPRLVCSHLNTK